MGGVALRVPRTQPAPTFAALVLVVVVGGGVLSVRSAQADDSEMLFLQDVGITSKPDLVKANISQEEYIDKMNLYLSRRTSLEGNQPNETPQLVSYTSEHKSWKRKVGDSLQYRMHLRPMGDKAIQGAELRVLLPPAAHAQQLQLRVFTTSRLRNRMLLSTRHVQLSETQPKWAEFDVSAAFGDLDALVHAARMDFTLACDACLIDTLHPLRTHVNILLTPRAAQRRRRSYFDMGRPTDCVNVNVLNDRKPNCCRHDMHVSFAKLSMDYIIQPKHYEAGFCRGRCPYHFNHATNHSRIQSLVHRQDKRAIPRSCCAPSKLDPLEILMVDPHDPSKLIVEQWNDMIVSECLCA